MLSSQFYQSGKAGVLALHGELTLENADELRSAFIKALINNAAEVVLNFEKATRVDFSCLQLLCSVHRTSARLKKGISFNGALPDILKRTIVKAGFARCTGCDPVRKKSCFWAGCCT